MKINCLSLELARPEMHALLTLCLAALVFLLTAPAVTAHAASQELEDSKKISVYSEVEFEHSDNIFQLTDYQQSRMEANDAEDSESGRFDDMESISDYILSPTLGIKYDINGLGNEDLSLSARVRYNYYLENQEKSYPEVRIRIKHNIGKKGALLLEGNFLFDYFKRNYLSGYNDGNDNGNISRDERIYSSAVYDEYEGLLAYEHTLFKNKGKPLSQVDLRPFCGYSSRVYNSAFKNRGREVAFTGVGLTFEFLSRLDLELVYQYENTRYPGDNELVLFDETRFGSDVNADGELKGNAPLVTHIDRSANRHTLEINPSFRISKEILLFLGYEKRICEYTSDNPLDIEHYHNKSYRQKIKAGIQYDFSKSWSTEIEYNKTDDVNEENGNYSENCFIFSIQYNLL